MLNDIAFNITHGIALSYQLYLDICNIATSHLRILNMIY